MIWRCLLIGMAIGGATELVARGLRLWLFRRPLLVLVNIVALYGLVMGSLATRVRPAGPLSVFAVAALVGLAVELLNLQFLRIWHFPDGRADDSRARLATILLLSFLWGILPLAIASAEAEFRTAGLFAPPKTPIEQVEERERQLLEKQAALQNRMRDIEGRLEAVRARRERLLQKQKSRAGGPHREAEESR